MKYVLLFVETEQFAKDLRGDGPGRPRPGLHAGGPVVHGTCRQGPALRSPDTATTVRLDRGDPVVLDGPFVEGKRSSAVTRKSKPTTSTKLAMVRTWPGCPVVEIRPLES